MLYLSRVSKASVEAGKPHRNSAADISAPPSSTGTDTEPPEGGLEAWCTVLGCFLAQFCGFGSDEIANLTNSFLRSELPGERELISHFMDWKRCYVSGDGDGPMCGPLFDRGYFYHVYISGAILQSLSIFMLSFVKPGSYYQVLLVQGLGSGIGQGLVYVPSFAVLSHHFNRRRTAMMSIVASGVALGGIVHTIMLNKLLNGSVGFQTGVRASAAFLSVFASEVWIHAKDDVGEFLEGNKEVLYGGASLLTIFGLTLFQTGYLYPFFYFQIDSLRHGLSTSFAFYSRTIKLVIINAGSFIGRFCAVLVTPFIGIVDLTIVTTVVCAILIIGMIWLGTVVSVVVLGILYGLFSGMNLAMMGPMLALTSDPAELGVRMGVGFAITGFGGLLGTPICGALLTSRYIWWRPALFCGAIALAGGLLFIALRVVLRTAAKAEMQ
ncbi:major facilitator superfamily domain-containing protein [Melanogaster broomeanus]|nr:major facilitator superfamily domain-containing protein [Melanogaster broomeanus]